MQRQFNYDGCRFTRSDISNAPIARYTQEGNILHGSFAGADIVFGCLSGVVAGDGALHFTYSMVDRSNNVIAGECRSIPDLDIEVALPCARNGIGLPRSDLAACPS